jgi:hypothetical protein
MIIVNIIFNYSSKFFNNINVFNNLTYIYYIRLFINLTKNNVFIKGTALLPDGVIGNTSDSGSEVSRFEPWSGSIKLLSFYH